MPRKIPLTDMYTGQENISKGGIESGSLTMIVVTSSMMVHILEFIALESIALRVRHAHLHNSAGHRVVLEGLRSP